MRLLRESGTCDIEMRPAGVAHEMLEEERRRDRSCASSPDVLDVRVPRADMIFVLLKQGELPVILTDLLAMIDDRVDQLLVVTHDAGDAWSERDNTRAGQRRQINNRICTVFARYTQGCLLYTSPSPRDRTRSRMPSSA